MKLSIISFDQKQKFGIWPFLGIPGTRNRKVSFDGGAQSLRYETVHLIQRKHQTRKQNRLSTIGIPPNKVAGGGAIGSNRAT